MGVVVEAVALDVETIGPPNENDGFAAVLDEDGPPNRLLEVGVLLLPLTFKDTGEVSIESVAFTPNEAPELLPPKLNPPVELVLAFDSPSPSVFDLKGVEKESSDLLELVESLFGLGVPNEKPPSLFDAGGAVLPLPPKEKEGLGLNPFAFFAGGS